MAHPTFEPGQVIAGRYVVKQSLGKGGMASLYAVHPLELPEGELLALKAVPLTDERQRKRLRAEFETLSRLRHRGIVRVFEHGEDAATGCAFYLMEYVRGSALTRVVRDSFMDLAGSMEQLHVEPRGPWRGILSYAAIGLGCLLTGLFMRAPSAPTLPASVVAPELAPAEAPSFSGLDASTPLPGLFLGAKLITGPLPGQKLVPCVKYPNLEVPFKGACWYVFALSGPSAEEAAKGCARDDVFEPEPGWCKRGSDIGWPRVYMPTMLDKPFQPPVSVLEPTPSDGGDPSAGAPR